MPHIAPSPDQSNWSVHKETSALRFSTAIDLVNDTCLERDVVITDIELKK